MLAHFEAPTPRTRKTWFTWCLVEHNRITAEWCRAIAEKTCTRELDRERDASSARFRLASDRHMRDRWGIPPGA